MSSKYKYNRIVCLVPSLTELLHYMGVDDRVVGITKFCIHPNEWFRTKVRVGGTKQVHFDKLLDLNPDLVIVNKEENTKEIVEEIEKLGINYLLTDINTLEEACDAILEIGRIVQKEKEAINLKIEIVKSFESIQSVKGQKVAYFIWKDPWMVVATNNFIHDILVRCGFKNVFEKETRYPMVELESITDVDVVMLSSEPFPFKKKHIEELKGYFPHSKIILVDGEYFSWYGSRLVGSVEYINGMLKENNL